MSNKSTVLPLLAGAALMSFTMGPADASVFRINYSASFENIDPAILGATGDRTVSLSFDIDTSAAPITLLPASAGYTTDLYGFDRSAISDFSLDFGTALWTKDSISSRIAAVGFDADVWFDQSLADGASPKTWMFLDGPLGYITFGGAICGNPCYLRDRAEINDAGNRESIFTSSMNVSVQEISPVPLPASLPLLAGGLGLLGFLGWRRRTPRVAA